MQEWRSHFSLDTPHPTLMSDTGQEIQNENHKHKKKVWYRWKTSRTPKRAIVNKIFSFVFSFFPCFWEQQTQNGRLVDKKEKHRSCKRLQDSHFAKARDFKLKKLAFARLAHPSDGFNQQIWWPSWADRLAQNQENHFRLRINRSLAHNSAFDILFARDPFKKN